MGAKFESCALSLASYNRDQQRRRRRRETHIELRAAAAAAAADWIGLDWIELVAIGLDWMRLKLWAKFVRVRARKQEHREHTHFSLHPPIEHTHTLLHAASRAARAASLVKCEAMKAAL